MGVFGPEDDCVTAQGGEAVSAGDVAEGGPPALPVRAGRRGVDDVKISATVPEAQRPPKLYVLVLSTAFATGFAFNLLLGDAPGVGLNLTLALAVFIGGWFLITRQRDAPAWRKLCMLAAFVYAVAMSLRASEILFTVNVLLVAGFIGLGCTAATSRWMKDARDSVVDLLQMLFNLCFGALLLIPEVPWARFKLQSKGARVASGIAMGVCIALPFLIVFGFLFSRAEVRFGQLFQTVFTTLATTIFSNFLLTFFITVVTLGLLKNAFLSAPITENQASAPGGKTTIGFVESVTVLSLLNAMFLMFVVTQLPYLFGGQAQVSSTPDLAWSEYARRGFFELAWVATLLIPTLILFLSCSQAESMRAVRLVQGLCGGLSVLTGIIIISALQRMLLYTHNFGLTELRIYVSTFIVMLALIIILLNCLNFTGRLRLFLPVALVTGFVFSVGMQVPNVQGIIAADIINREQSDKGGDMEYLEKLSVDSVPAVMASSLPAEHKNIIAAEILAGVVDEGEKPGWLYHPLSVIRAASLVRLDDVDER